MIQFIPNSKQCRMFGVSWQRRLSRCFGAWIYACKSFTNVLSPKYYVICNGKYSTYEMSVPMTYRAPRSRCGQMWNDEHATFHHLEDWRMNVQIRLFLSKLYDVPVCFSPPPPSFEAVFWLLLDIGWFVLFMVILTNKSKLDLYDLNNLQIH